MRGVLCGKNIFANMPSNMLEERGRSKKSRSRSASSKSSSSSKSSRSRSSSRSRAGSAKSSRSRSRSSSKSKSPIRFVSRSRSRSSSRSRSRSRSKSVSKSPAQTPRSSSPVQTPRSTSPVQTPRSSSSESRDRSQSAERLPSPPTEAPRGLLRQVMKNNIPFQPLPFTVLSFFFRQQQHQSPQVVPRKTMQTMRSNPKCLQNQCLKPPKRQNLSLLPTHHLPQPPAQQRVLQAGFF